jgi:MFS family permease
VFRRLCAINGLLVVFGYSQYHAALPLFLSRPGGLRASGIAVVFAVNTITVMFAAIPMAAATRRCSRPSLILAGALCFAASWALLATTLDMARGPGPLLVAAFAASVMGIGETLLAASFGPLVNELAPDNLRGHYNAADAFVLSVGTIGGPLLAGVVIAGPGVAVLLAVLTAGCLLAATTTRAWKPSSPPGGDTHRSERPSVPERSTLHCQ